MGSPSLHLRRAAGRWARQVKECTPCPAPRPLSRGARGLWRVVRTAFAFGTQGASCCTTNCPHVAFVKLGRWESRPQQRASRRMPATRMSDTPQGLKPHGFSVHRPAIARTPRRRCPRHWILRAAFSSRSMMSPQWVQTWVRTESDFWMRSPQPLQSCEVYAGLTASARFPAHAALKARRVRNWPHPASRRLLLRPASRAAPLW